MECKKFNRHLSLISLKNLKKKTKKNKKVLPNADRLACQIDVIRCVITAELSISFFGSQNGFLNCKCKITNVFFWWWWCDVHSIKIERLSFNLTTSFPESKHIRARVKK